MSEIFSFITRSKLLREYTFKICANHSKSLMMLDQPLLPCLSSALVTDAIKVSFIFDIRFLCFFYFPFLWCNQNNNNNNNF